MKVTASSPKEIVKEVNGILKNYNVEIIRLKVIEDEDVPDYVRIIMKYRESTDKNEILSKLIEIEKVKEVVEE